jgi:ribosome-binding protein aMBF1 (putative translation factor)
MIRNKYERILDQFELYYPSLYEQSVDWWASGRTTISVRLQDQSVFEYNHIDNTIRRIRVDDYSEDESVRRKAFGHNLQKIISGCGMSQNDLAEKVGITNAMLSRYIHGTSMPSADKAHMIANTIGCTMDELFDDTYMD